ncbi:MAG: zinc ABC transporter substrate-binding protein [Actinobacteria bacterium]|nr:zinc ABC transporter substrate-binding protein [Actinomycetota bacterium]
MKIKYLIIIGILILAVFLVGCQRGVITQNKDKLDVIVSILPQKAFVKAIGGEHVNVKELIPPGGSPATYEPKPSDLANVEKADIYFRLGHIPFEKSHADKFASLNPNMKIVDTSVNVELRHFGEHGEEIHEEEHHHEGVDPHVWLSPMQVKKQVDVIANTLSEIDPDNFAEYMKNAKDFKKELDDLHNELELKFKELKTDKLMVFHPAWGYFADEFSLEQIAIEQDGKEPTAKQLQHLIDEAREENIKVIFIQSQFNKEIAESIADEIDAVVVSINPLSDDYINNLRNVATTITEHLN